MNEGLKVEGLNLLFEKSLLSQEAIKNTGIQSKKRARHCSPDLLSS